VTRSWSPETPDPDLSALARTERLVVALDFDGTAAEYTVDPMASRAVPEVADAVRQLVALPDTVVAYVSGRSLIHLREIVEHDDESPIALAGSHGAQYWFPGDGEADPVESEDDRALRERLFEELAVLLEDYPGVELERKTLGAGIHGRPADPAVEERAFAAVDALMAERAPHWRRRTGHRILEFSSLATGKDAAIGALRERYDATAILFAGDDVTDEDAMRVLRDGDLGVRVGAGETAATLRVRNPQEIGALLETLAHERAALRE
jgi:trehalose 6-phosphate phosphatase